MIVMVEEVLGAGKTTIASIFSCLYMAHGRLPFKECRFVNPNPRVFSTVPLSLPGCQHINTLAALQYCRNGLMVLDDPYDLLDSREKKTGTSGPNIVLQRSRKRGLDILTTSVRTMDIDIKLRRNCVRVLRPEMYYWENEPIALKIHIYVYESRLDGGDKNPLIQELPGILIGQQELKFYQSLFDTTFEVETLPRVDI